jgi:hypothetical protein
MHTTVKDIIDEIQHIYGLYNDIAKELCFTYHTFSNRGKQKKYVHG